MTDEPFCCRCKEDFPVAKEPSRWAMGFLRPLKLAPASIRKKLKEWLDSELQGPGYLCGNCFFDMTDEEEDNG